MNVRLVISPHAAVLLAAMASVWQDIEEVYKHQEFSEEEKGTIDATPEQVFQQAWPKSQDATWERKAAAIRRAAGLVEPQVPVSCQVHPFYLIEKDVHVPC